MNRTLVVLPTRHDVEQRVARELVAEILDSIERRGRADIAVTGGTVGIGSLAAVRDIDTTDVDWSRVHVWWGDERFVPEGDPDRNEGQARAALFDHVEIPDANLHVFPARGDQNVDDAAQHFRKAFDDNRPSFDVALNGIGPDGHVASLFPGLDHGEGYSVIAVHDSPKPPAERMSFTFETLNAARRVWIVASGDDKADAIHRLMNDSPRSETPATALSGREETAVWVDTAAAAQLAD